MVPHKFGNVKIGKDTLIVNMGPATGCPSDAKGLCALGAANGDATCYAYKAERQYASVKSYRVAQRRAWDQYPAEDIVKYLLSSISRRRTSTVFVRWNESGDFRHLDDVAKLAYIASLMPSQVHYLYTHRWDILKIVDRDALPKNLVISISVDAWNAHLLPDMAGWNTFKVVDPGPDSPDSPACPGNCRNCTLCKTQHGTTIFIHKH